MRIGVFGGSFDPPHIGHLEMAKAARDQLELDEVVFVPAQRNPLKTFRASASAKDRLEMVRLMIEGEPAFAVTDIEIQRGGASYTVETLDQLQVVSPGEYWLLVGLDSALQFDKWRSWQRILRLARLAVFHRNLVGSHDLSTEMREEVAERADILTFEAMDVSSTEIRTRLYERKPIGNALHPAVEKYIKEKKLYANSTR